MPALSRAAFVVLLIVLAAAIIAIRCDGDTLPNTQPDKRDPDGAPDAVTHPDANGDPHGNADADGHPAANADGAANAFGRRGLPLLAVQPR